MSIRTTLHIFALIWVAYGGQMPASAQTGGCNAPEVVPRHASYNAFVCAGSEKMDAGRFAEAARDFEQALAIRLFEIPNFQLFPKLALAYSRAGDKRAARLNLERGRIALSLLVGVYHCDETPTGYLLDEAGTPLEGPQASEIMRRMCGAIYEHIYTSSSLEGFVWRARLVEYYFTVAKEIEGR